MFIFFLSISLTVVHQGYWALPPNNCIYTLKEFKNREININKNKTVTEETKTKELHKYTQNDGKDSTYHTWLSFKRRLGNHIA